MSRRTARHNSPNEGRSASVTCTGGLQFKTTLAIAQAGATGIVGTLAVTTRARQSPGPRSDKLALAGSQSMAAFADRLRP